MTTSCPSSSPAPEEKAEKNGGGAHDGRGSYCYDAADKRDADDEVDDAVVVAPELLARRGVTAGDLRTAVRVLNAVASLDRRRRGGRRGGGNNDDKKQKKKKRNSNNNNGGGGASAAKNGDEDNELGGAAKNGDDDNQDDEEDDGLEAFKHRNLRPLRKALAGCLELHRRTMFNGKAEEEHYERRIQERSLKRQKTTERDLKRKYIESTVLRRGRIERLRQLQDDAQDEEIAKTYMIPDGHVETTATNGGIPLLEGGRPSIESGGDSDTAQPSAADREENGGSAPSPKNLPQHRSCYVCKVRYRILHHFYDQLCPPCASLNWQKRHQTADCAGKVAVVTGARVKIGFQVCLKLLRSGATVVATTRFPNSACHVYRSEPDFDQWKHRLQVYGLDFRDVTGLEAFTRFLKLRFGHCGDSASGVEQCGIDILINNACQTVRRPVAYYQPVVEREQQLWRDGDEAHKSLLLGCVEFERVRRQLDLDHISSESARQHQPQRLSGEESRRAGKVLMPEPAVEDGSKPSDSSAAIVASHATDGAAVVEHANVAQSPFETTGLSHSAAMSQTIVLPDDAGVSDDILPPGITDVNGQQLDLRKTNSWLLKMEEVSTPEVMECMFVNAIAPFVLNSRLKPLMTVPRDDNRPDRYIINVSAMEGKFYRYKMPNHPHTNMAKASLNMLTRTSAEDLAKRSRIFMNSVDTGWINDENPIERAKRTAEQNKFQTPIDEIDAAARILDPVFSGINHPDRPKEYGKFLKDYSESEW